MPEFLPTSDRRGYLQRASALAILGLTVHWKAQSLPLVPKRVVCIGGGLTEIVYALHAEPCLVGVDSTSLFPVAATRLPNVGYARTLSAEGILQLAPHMILLTEDAGPLAVLGQIRAAGITVQVLSAQSSFEAMQQRVETVGKLLQCSAAATSLNQTLNQRWQSVRQQVLASRAKPKLRVLFVLAHIPGQMMVAGRDTAADHLLRYAGAENAAKAVVGHKPLSAEALIVAAPDVVVVTTIADGTQSVSATSLTPRQQASILALPGMAQTPAGRRQHVLGLEVSFALGFGPRLPEAVRALHQGLQA